MRPSQRPTAASIRRLVLTIESPQGGTSEAESAAFFPPTDVYETPEGFEVRLEVAGLDKDNVDIQIGSDGRTLTVVGSRPIQASIRGARVLNLEIPYGRFSRRIVLPSPVDAAQTQATYTQGFLTIHLPKAGRGTRRRVPIEVIRPVTPTESAQ